MFTRYFLLALLGVVQPAMAQTQTAEAMAASKDSGPLTDPKNRIGAAWRFPINVSVDFKNVGGFKPLGVNVPGVGMQPGNPGPADGSLANRTYENGYAWVDSSTNAGGLTWFWGYNNADAQAFPNNSSPAAIQLQSSSSAQASIDDRADDALAGFEITYSRELFRNKTFRFGMETAFGYNDIGVDTEKTIHPDVQRTTDSFLLSGADYGSPLRPSHQGTFDGPAPGEPTAPLVSAQPSRANSVIPKGAEVQGTRSLTADLFSLRIGPYLEIPITDRISTTLGAGAAIVYVQSEFHYRETVSIPNVGLAEHSASGHDNGWVFGWYAGLSVSAEVKKNWRVIAGAQFQSVEDYTHKEGGKKAILRMGEACFFNLGVAYSF